MLTGSAPSPAESQQAYDIAARLVGRHDKVVNGIAVHGRDQVMLKVTVAEVRAGRDQAARHRSVRHARRRHRGGELQHHQSFSGQRRPSGRHLPDRQVSQRHDNVARHGARRRDQHLAEPNLTAISGETANFIAGGEFPIPNGRRATRPSRPACQPQITFKKFGVSLELHAGRPDGRPHQPEGDDRSLRPSTENAMTLQVTGSTTSLTVPSIQTRRAETTVEIPSGGALAMAGMIQEQTKQAINGLPGLMQVPILGALFKSRDYVNHQSELVVLVRPYVVRAVAQKQLSRPDDGFSDPNDPQSVCLAS